MKFTIKIGGIPGADGEYELDLAYFTNRELHKIKQMSGVRAGEVEEAFNARDNDLLIAFTSIALSRNGKNVPDDALWDAHAGTIQFAAVEEDDAGPPEIPAEPHGSLNGDAASSASSGSSSSGNSVHPASPPSSTGSQPSATGAVSAPETLRV